jgi:hypothetical protein
MITEDDEAHATDLGIRCNTVPPEGFELVNWRASRYSNGFRNNLLEVGRVRSGPGAGGVLVRNRRGPHTDILAFSEAEWIAFLDDAESFRGEHP